MGAKGAGSGRARWAWTLAALCVACASLVAFSPALSAGFVNWDDDIGIVRNSAFRGLGRQQLAWMWTTGLLGHFHPLTWLSLSIDHALWGLDPAPGSSSARGFHLTSVALHAATAVGFLALASGVLRRGLPRARPETIRLAALFAALFFAVHPLRAESVAWVTERRDVLSGLFFVACLCAWWIAVARERPNSAPRIAPAAGAVVAAALAVTLALAAVDLSSPLALALRTRGELLLGLALFALAASALLAARIQPLSARGTTWLCGAVTLALLSLLAKAWGIVLPALLLVADAWPLGRLAAAGAPRWKRALALLAEKSPFVALSLVFGRLALWAQGGQPGTMASLETHTLAERAVQGIYGLFWYPFKSLLPLDLTPYVGVPDRVSLIEPRFALATTMVAAAVFVLLLLRRRWPGLLAAASAFALIVSPVLGVAQSGTQLVADRYSYLSGLPLALALAGALAWLAGRGPTAAKGAVVVGVAWLLLLAAAGHRQARIWHDSRSLWRRALSVDPANGYTCMRLAQVLLETAETAREPGERTALVDQAFELLERHRRENDPVWLSVLAQASLQRARLDPARRDELSRQATELVDRAVALRGERVDPELGQILAITLIEAGQPERALGELRAYVEARPFGPLGWVNLGVALAASGRAQEALGPLRRGLELDPGYAKGWRFLALACEAAGDRNGALEAWRRLLELWPQHEQARARVRALESGG